MTIRAQLHVAHTTRQRLLLAAAGLLAVSVVIGATAYARYEYADTRTYWNGALETLAKGYVDRTTDADDAARQTTAGIGRLVAQFGGRTQAMDSAFGALIAAGLGQSFSVVTASGQVVATQPATATPYPQELSAAMKAARTGETTYVGPFSGPAGGVASVVAPAGPGRAVIRRLRDESVSYFAGSWWPRTAQTSQIYILRRAHDSIEVITPLRLPASKPLAMRVATSRLSPLWRAATNGPASAGLFVDHRGKHVIASSIPMGDGRVLIAQVDEDEAMYDAQSLAASLAIVVVVTAILVLVGVVAVRRSRRLRAAQRAAAEGRKLSAIVANAMDAIVVTDGGGRVLEMNAAAMQLFGWSRTDIGRPVADVLRLKGAGGDTDSGMTQLIDALAAGTGSGDPREIHHGDQVLEVTASVAVDGASSRLAFFFRDVTESRRLQGAVRRAEELLMLGRLSGGIAHEFNNALQIVSGFAELLRDELDPDAHAQRSVEHIRETTSRLADITRQLLSFGRQQILRPAEVDIVSVVREVVHQISTSIPKAQGKINFSMSVSDPAVFCRVDAGFLAEAIRELVQNAETAMTGAGAISILVMAHDDYVVVQVVDDGRGMSADTLAHARDPFFTTQSRALARGLGLSAVDGFVAQSGGSLRMSSQLGRGTTVEITLPRVDPPRRDAPPEGSGFRVQGQPVALIADDEANVRTLLERHLGILGYTVRVSDNGEDALSLASNGTERPSLLITDLVMPGMSGAELVQRMRRDNPDLKAVIISGFGGAELARRGVRLEEGSAFLEKPFKLSALRAVLKGLNAA